MDHNGDNSTPKKWGKCPNRGKRTENVAIDASINVRNELHDFQVTRSQ